jgi:hypothetical protein
VIPFNATDVCQNAMPFLSAIRLVLRTSMFPLQESQQPRKQLEEIFHLPRLLSLVVTVASILFRRFVRTLIDRLVRATREIGSGQWTTGFQTH